MRATRAYIAGFGTAGSLLAGAAMVFVLASAVVAFRGWPQVGTTATPASVVVWQPHAAAPSPVHLRLEAATGAAARTPVAAAVSTPPAGGSSRTGQATKRVRIASTQTGRIAPPAVTVSTPPVKPTDPTPVCGAACQKPTVTGTVSTVVQNTTGTVGNTVAQAGQSLGSTVSGLTNAVATKLAPLSPAVANTVSAVGSAVGGIVTNAGNAAGQAVNGLGHTLSSVLGALGGHSGG